MFLYLKCETRFFLLLQTLYTRKWPGVHFTTPDARGTSRFLSDAIRFD